MEIDLTKSYNYKDIENVLFNLANMMVLIYIL